MSGGLWLVIGAVIGSVLAWSGVLDPVFGAIAEVIAGLGV